MQGKMQVRKLGEGRHDLPGEAGSRGPGKRVVQGRSTVHFCRMLFRSLCSPTPLPPAPAGLRPD